MGEKKDKEKADSILISTSSDSLYISERIEIDSLNNLQEAIEDSVKLDKNKKSSIHISFGNNNKKGDNADLEGPLGSMVYIYVALLSLLLLLFYMWPIKRYFKKLKKGSVVEAKLRQKVKKRIYQLPLVASLLFSLIFVVQRMEELYIVFFDVEISSLSESMAISGEFITTSIVAALVTIIFVYQWFQYKVETQYLEHVLTPEELIYKDKEFFTGKIRNRLWTSSLMTTFLPILIVFLYITINVSHVPKLMEDTYTKEVKTILFGEALVDRASIGVDDIPSWVFYYDIPNSFLMVFGMMSSMIVAFIYVFFFIRWTTARIVVPIHDLLDKMHLVQNGDFTSYTYIKTPDEMGRLTSGYNEMVTKLGVYFKDINEMKDSYRRFVPQQFLDYLGKEKFSDIKLGDQVEKEMSVLFSDIRDFTSISEKMTPQQNFNFINDYLSYMEPVISKYHGFIDKYIGDAIMALFPNPDDAIKAALEMLDKLEEFNVLQKKKERPIVKIGLGIHTGNLMLGVIGGVNRMEGTVISDAVNLAARLEGLTKKYKRTIIISDSTKNKMMGKEIVNFEFLGETKVKGKEKSTEIYSITKKLNT